MVHSLLGIVCLSALLILRPNDWIRGSILCKELDFKIFPQGHGPSNYTKWVTNTNTSDDFYEIALSQKQSILYEPYVAGFKPGIPRYWEGKTTI
jgi:hypothetical protein